MNTVYTTVLLRASRIFLTRAFLGYVAALAGPVVITWAQLKLLNLQAPFALSFVAVQFIARLFSLGSALLATATSAFLVNYFFLEPVGELTFGDSAGSSTFLFVLVTATAATMLRRNIELAMHERANAALARKLQQELVIEQQKVDRALSQTPAAIVINGGKDWRYEFINERAKEMMAPGLHALGMPLAMAMPELAREVGPLLDSVREQRTSMTVREYPLTLYANGRPERRFCDFTYQPLFAPDDFVESVMTFCVDVHEAVTLRRKTEALAEARGVDLRARDDFIAIAGHELKTPVTALLLQMQMLQRRLAADAAPSQTRIKSVVEHQVHLLGRLTHLIDTLLDVSRLSQGRIEFCTEAVELSQLLTDVVARLQPMAANAGATLRVVEPVSVVGVWDRLRLEQILTNLISNAIKYGNSNPVEISIDADGNGVQLRVIDHGIGIGEEDQDRIFERFERIRNRRVSGLGLGLWITRRLVTAMGGNLGVTSSPAKGSTFTVWLPLASPPPKISQISSERHGQS